MLACWQMATGTQTHRQPPGARAPQALAPRDRDGRQPKYLRIHRELSDRISSGQWPAGSLLPAQQQLAAELGVSVMTLRQALQLLADDGLIEARHGAGTYVRSRYAYDLGGLRSFAADLSDQDAAITTDVLSAGAAKPPPDVAARLGAPAEVFRLRRLRLARGRPLIVQTSYLPAELAGLIGPHDLAQQGLYTILAEHGLAVTRADETITAATLGPRDARDLDRPVASPALLSHRISFAASGSPVIDDYALLPADAVAITVNRSPGHLEVRYTLAG
jgi:GntR family transcriptional regulator